MNPLTTYSDGELINELTNRGIIVETLSTEFISDYIEEHEFNIDTENDEVMADIMDRISESEVVLRINYSMLDSILSDYE